MAPTNAPQFRSLLRKHFVSHDVEGTVRRICEELGLDEKQSFSLYPPLRAAVVNWERNLTIKVERAAFRVVSNPETAEPEFLTNNELRRQLLDAEFYTGKRYVRWSEATVQDHRDRVALLRSQQDGIERTIQSHLHAIEMIEKAGVTCLAKVFGESA